MKWLLLVVALAACKPKEVPYQPPPKDDAAVKPDAAIEIDAAVVEVKAEATKLVVGDHASCALLADATVRCWGRNSDGQLGNNTTIDSATPVKPNLRGVKDLVMGAAHVCALLDDESVTCWGKINYGPKGSLHAPSAASGVAKAKRLFAVGSTSCATLADSSLVCWGDIDARGHLRPAGTGPTRPPAPAAGLDRVVAITARGALRDDGTVWFWGEDGEPVRTQLKDVIEIASFGGEVCGLRRDGSVACAGPATRCAEMAPKAPSAPKPATQAGKGRAKGKGKGKVTAKPAPAPETSKAMPIEVLRLSAAKHLAFDAGPCVVTRAGKLSCLAASDGCRVDAPWPGLASVDYVVDHCARLTDGDVRCWATDGKHRVHEVAGVDGALAVAASSSHACAITRDRSVVCWGSNRFGALGRGDADEQAHREASGVTL